jgi:radical SAM protein with 4Fe4S-binding SPASM domain
MNINRLLAMNIRVHIRMNVSATNGLDLLKLVDIIKDTCCSYFLKPLVYSHLIFGLNGSDKEIAFGFLQAIEKKIDTYGLSRTYNPLNIRRTHCMANDGHSLIFTPEGNITLCEHHCDDEIIGDIQNGIHPHKVIEWNKSTELEFCSQCIHYPSCRHLDKCPVESGCDSCDRKLKDYIAEITIKKAYKRYLKQGANHNGG